MTWNKWLIKAVERLRKSHISSANIDAEILLSHVTGACRPYLIAFCETVLTDLQSTVLERLLQRRELGEPIAYLIGECNFWSFRIRVSYDTFIPREDTECLVQCALDLPISKKAEVLDLGTGSGAIALALASERPEWMITGVDRLQKTLLLLFFS